MHFDVLVTWPKLWSPIGLWLYRLSNDVTRVCGNQKDETDTIFPSRLLDLATNSACSSIWLLVIRKLELLKGHNEFIYTWGRIESHSCKIKPKLQRIVIREIQLFLFEFGSRSILMYLNFVFPVLLLFYLNIIYITYNIILMLPEK